MEPIGADRGNGGGLLERFRRAQRALLRLVPKTGRPLAPNRAVPGAEAQAAFVIRFPGAPTGAQREMRLETIRARISGGYYDRPEVRDGMARNLMKSFEQEH